ncbi:unnamed protein product [Brassicogethes aeneus]|uniref:Myelin regulatory factor n=1 Tax=Brassicogethes aeneus TaxID=1431903 RepID=A0A9P0AWA0_BRAAE|nr:unnamed protein product [Brassicogethes aeneus]
MDSLAADLAIQAILGRETDFVGGIDNVDFSQLDDYIYSDTSQGNASYFGESLNTAPSNPGKILIVESKRNNNGHSLPESPPDSSSEHPYSPEHGCEPPLAPYTAIAAAAVGGGPQNVYKPAAALINSIIPNGLISLNPHLVVDQGAGGGGEGLLEGGGMLGDVGAAHLQDAQALMADGRIILTEAALDENNRQILLASQDANQNFERYKTEDYDKTSIVHLAYQQHQQQQQLEPLPARTNLEDPSSIESIHATVYTNLQTARKKRKLSQESPLVKSEPEHLGQSQLSPGDQLAGSVDEEYASSEACLSESQYQCIRFNSFQQNGWHVLCDQNLTELPTPHYRVDADKGFNFSNADDAFVCQKKNHFQITCQVRLFGDAQFVKTPDGFQKISSFHIHFYGVKHDCPTQTIRVEQSQSDRSKKPFHPVPIQKWQFNRIELINSQVVKLTVGRLHFSETTSNNMRKKGKPNPEQRYFQLVVGLHAHTSTGNFAIVSHASQKIIVRASNPGQFESDIELCWQKGQTQDSIFHNGRVGVNTDRPDESLVVHGNIKITGHIIQPSDIRAKKNIVECNTAEQLKNVQRIRVVKYEYEPALASQLSRDSECSDTGVIAQEVAEILPEAVKPAGDLILENGTSIRDFLVVNKERIFMENIGAVKELCKVTDNLETRIDQLERINRRLNNLKRSDSFKSNSTVSSSKLSFSHKCPKHHVCKKEEEFCSNKFIQIVIVVLVLIMAFCLAAITTLYLMEAARYSRQYLQPSVDVGGGGVGQRAPPTKRPPKTPPSRSTSSMAAWRPTSPVTARSRAAKDGGGGGALEGGGGGGPKTPVDPTLIRSGADVGRPADCYDENMETSLPCQTYCCASSQIVAPPDLTPFEKKSALNKNRTTLPLINSDKNKVSKPFHSNDIDKQVRQRREAFDENDDSNAFFVKDEHQSFDITIQGRNFNTTLLNTYHSNYYNFTYLVPISKFMPDEFVNLMFRSTQANVKEIEYCHNDYKQYECLYEKERSTHKVNEYNPSQFLSLQSTVFKVDMRDFRYKSLTYRASLKQTQNTCKLSSVKLGLEFIEYNFIFYRHCD